MYRIVFIVISVYVVFRPNLGLNHFSLPTAIRPNRHTRPHGQQASPSKTGQSTGPAS